jgi:hypothetical protein
VALHFALAKVAKDANLERTSLPLSFDILLENKSYKDYQLRRLSLQDARASTYDQVSQCTENCIYLGEIFLLGILCSRKQRVKFPFAGGQLHFVGPTPFRGVSMDSLKYCLGLSCLTTVCPAGGHP